MTEPLTDVDKVVREVLAVLGAAPKSPAVATQTSGAGDPSGSPAPPSERDGVLEVGGQVVTMAELEGRLGGIKRVVVPAGSVVTPSVRDELRRKNVSLVYGRAGAAASGGGVRLAMVVLGSRYDPGLLARALEGEGIDVDARQADCLIAATDQLAGELSRPDTLGLVLTRYPAVALCLANRHRGVRAVWSVDAATAAFAAASVGANVLVIDPQTVGFFQLRRMVGRFCDEGPRECPESIRERLG
ncbi:MAG: hypothetical protein ABIK89_10535 [Planctomycetota bacterium]